MILSVLRSISALLAVLLAFCGSVQAADDESVKQPKGTVSLGFEFASGSYVGTETTRSIYMPLVATWFPTDRIDIGIEIPFVYQSSPNTPAGMFQTIQGSTAKTVAMGNGQHSGGLGLLSGTSGIGDIIIRLGMISLFESTRVPQLRPSLFIKCPTASKSDNLGTGEFDAGVGLEASKWFGRANISSEVFYVYQGKTASWGLKNYFSYNAGVAYQITETVIPRLVVKGASAISDNTEAPFEVRAQLGWVLTRTTSLDFFASRGLSDSSPDFGGGIAVIYSF